MLPTYLFIAADILLVSHPEKVLFKLVDNISVCGNTLLGFGFYIRFEIFYFFSIIVKLNVKNVSIISDVLLQNQGVTPVGTEMAELVFNLKFHRDFELGKVPCKVKLQQVVLEKLEGGLL